MFKARSEGDTLSAQQRWVQDIQRVQMFGVSYPRFSQPAPLSSLKALLDTKARQSFMSNVLLYGLLCR